jgi:DNA-binding response OmpR family regulator
MRVLVVEDEPKIAKEVGLALESEGFRVELCSSGEDAFFRATTSAYDAIVLDRMLPGRDGVSVLKMLRQQGCRTPVLMLTAVGGVDDRVEGLSAGADDYVVKPFAISEVVARVKALLRRGSDTAEREIVRGSLRLDLLARRATLRGDAVALTSTEWELLTLLARSAGAAVSRDAIVHHLWPEHSRSASTDNLIDVHVGRLRRKLETSENPSPIKTVRGLGFLLDSDI